MSMKGSSVTGNFVFRKIVKKTNYCAHVVLKLILFSLFLYLNLDNVGDVPACYSKPLGQCNHFAFLDHGMTSVVPGCLIFLRSFTQIGSVILMFYVGCLVAS